MELRSSPILLRLSTGEGGWWRSGSPCCGGRGRRPPVAGGSRLPRMSGAGRGPSWRGGCGRGSVRVDSGGVFSSAVLTVELFPLSFFRAAELWASSGLALVVFNGLAIDEEEEDDSFFLGSPPSPVFFFTLSLFTFGPSVFTLTFTF